MKVQLSGLNYHPTVRMYYHNNVDFSVFIFFLTVLYKIHIIIAKHEYDNPE